MSNNVASDKSSTTTVKSVSRFSTMYDTVNGIVYASVTALTDSVWHMGSAVLGVIPNTLSYADMISQGVFPRMNQIVLKRNIQSPAEEKDEIKNLIGRVSKFPTKDPVPTLDAFSDARLALWVPSLFVASLIAVVGACMHLALAFAGLFPNARAVYRGYFDETKSLTLMLTEIKQANCHHLGSKHYSLTSGMR